MAKAAVVGDQLSVVVLPTEDGADGLAWFADAVSPTQEHPNDEDLSLGTPGTTRWETLNDV